LPSASDAATENATLCETTAGLGVAVGAEVMEGPLVLSLGVVVGGSVTVTLAVPLILPLAAFTV
jgi:hypothetical protein